MTVCYLSFNLVHFEYILNAKESIHSLLVDFLEIQEWNIIMCDIIV